MNRAIISIIAVILIVGVGYFVYKAKENSLEPSTNNPPDLQGGVENQMPVVGSTTPDKVVSEEPLGILISEVAKHNSRSSCWTAINGYVYDLSSWIPNHPGGEQPILGLCGKDGSLNFNTRHGSESKPKSVLAGFRIGKLAN